MHRWVLAVAIACLLSGTVVTAAEQEDDNDFTFSFSGQARFRPEYRNDADLDRDRDDDTRLGLMRLRVGLTVGIGDDYKLFFQVQDSRIAGEEASTASDEENLDLHQGYLELTPRAKDDMTVTLGRQEWSYGDQRLIGAFGWDNVGRSFDGARVRYSRERFWLDGLLARVTTRGVNGSTKGSDLYGAYAQKSMAEGAIFEGYVLSFANSIEAPGEEGELDSTAVHALGGRVKDTIGRFDFTVEAAVERGSVRGDDLTASAAAVMGGVTWGDTIVIRAFGGYDFATGDADPNDGDQGEFFNFFPTNHAHYGYADFEGWRNIRSPHAGASLKKGRHFVRAKFHRFMLEEKAGPWKSAGGVVLGHDREGNSGADVGDEVDLTYRYKWRDKTSVEAGVSRFEPGRFARRTRGDDPSHWGYLMLTLGF